MPEDDPLDRVRAAATAVHLAERALADAVRRAQAAGHSWAAVGAVLGTSRQAAFKRFGTPRDPRTGRPMAPADTAGVVATTESVFAALDAGRYDELRAMMPDDVARVLTRDVVLGAWARAVADTGNLVACRDTVVQLPGGEDAPSAEVLGTVVGATTLVCEAGEWQGRVALGQDGGLLGLLVVPVGADGLPF
ncbi:hypothetical protein SFC79_11775 [Nocardioides sp. S-58]|uniref:Uncharacterized protein n=1 Tax=Nocardioides renjunii TaxID=3095075 RepID=A0ABU5KBT9_9ACTN|nr:MULTISPECIES: hypothetical protein [unclassified Nocardioides]MDZ5662443.1 hypothetical protein [Nocardioides sp. S-58]WQQ23760.1 hypothetical protein SHK17_07165 [Nocardioides sp. S-34]